jgi:integrase
MLGPMGRRRRHDLGLPPLMYRKRGRYYYGREGTALGSDFPQALRKYAETHGGKPASGTFADAATRYEREKLAGKARKTQAEYGRQLATLVKVFGRMPLETIKPQHVRQYLDRRGKPIAAAREKAVLSLVFNFARGVGLTEAANPCAGIKAETAGRDRYVTDAELADALARADLELAGFLELCYLTGQRPGDVLRMRRQDVQDGLLWVQQGKNGAKVRIAVVGPLDALLTRLVAYPVASVYFVRDARGQAFTLAAMQKRFRALGCGWQIRDLRAKAASDSATVRDAQRLLGHSAATTTDGYIRARAGEKVMPIMREIK